MEEYSAFFLLGSRSEFLHRIMQVPLLLPKTKRRSVQISLLAPSPLVRCKHCSIDCTVCCSVSSARNPVIAETRDADWIARELGPFDLVIDYSHNTHGLL